MTEWRMVDELSRDELVAVLQQGSWALDNLETLQDEMRRVKGMYMPIEGGYKKLWHGLKPLGGKIAIAFGAMLLVSAFGRTFSEMVEVLFYTFGLSVGLAFFISNLLQCLIVILAPAIAQVVVNKRVVKHNRANADRLERNKLHNRKVFEEQQELQEKIDSVYAKYAEVSYLLPVDYKVNKHALHFMAKALDNGRATTLGGAINLYEEEMHRRRVEANQEEMLRKQDEANMLAMARLLEEMEANELRRQPVYVVQR